MKRALLCLILASLGGCSDRAEQSRAVLQRQKLDFSVDDYFNAARQGKLEAVQAFLTAGMKPEVTDAQGNTALLLAAEAGHGHVVRFLLEQHAKANIARADGDTPLIVAARQGDREAVRALLDAGADANARNAQDLTPLAEAALEGQVSALEILAPHSRSSLDYSLQLAAVKGRTEVIEALLKAGANVLTRSSENRTPLMYAAKYGHAEAVRLLLERGSNALALDDDLKTAAMLAEADSHPEAVAILNEPPAPTLAVEPGEFGPVVTASNSGGVIPSPHGLAASVAAPAGKLSGHQFTETTPTVFASDLRAVLKFSAYRERQLPFILTQVADDQSSAQVQLLTGTHAEATVAVGQSIPSTHLQIVSATHRLAASKAGRGKLFDVSTVLVRDEQSGERVLAQLNQAVTTADSFGVLRATADGSTWETRVGDRFQCGSHQYRVLDVRPTQVLVEDRASKETVVLDGIK